MLVLSIQQTISIFYGGATFYPAPVPHPVKPSETPAANRVDQGYDNVKCIVGQCYKASLWNCWRELSQVGKEESARQFLVLPTRGSLLSFALKFVAKPGVFTSPPRMHNGGRTNTILSASERLVGSSLAGWKGKHIFGEIHIRERARIPYSFSYQHKELSKLLNVRKLITDKNMSWA